MRHSPYLNVALASLAGGLLAACSTLSHYTELPPPSPAARMAAEAPPVADGSIYTAGREVTLFEDIKARRVGDTLTIVLTEATQASKSASTSTKKDNTIDMPGPIIAGQPITSGGNEILEMQIEAQRKFEGQGSSSQSNKLTGNITVTVVERLPNGNLVVAGEKWLRLNQGDEFVRIGGIVRPFDIRTDNTVTSDRVADARISYGGRGTLDGANRMGWLSRFFNSPVMPY